MGGVLFSALVYHIVHIVHIEHIAMWLYVWRNLCVVATLREKKTGSFLNRIISFDTETLKCLRVGPHPQPLS